MAVTIILIAITALVSYVAFNNYSLWEKLMMWPRMMQGQPQEYYRFLTSGFIHADYQHLIFNMLTLFFFGRNAELILTAIFGQVSSAVYGLFYLATIIISSVPAFIKHRNNGNYRSLGASGGVSGVVFFSIYYYPWSMINGFIPAFLYAVLYVGYSVYMSRRGMDNVGHDAHLGGAACGFIFAFIADPTHGQVFIQQLLHPVFR